MLGDNATHVIDITGSLATNEVSDDELCLASYAMFGKDGTGTMEGESCMIQSIRDAEGSR